jgi:hypothetical protein
MNKDKKSGLTIFEKGQILIIYSSFDQLKNEINHDGYFIRYALSKNGHLEKKNLVRIAGEYNEGQNKVLELNDLIGPFKDFSSLRAYCEKLIENIHAKEVILLSLKAYNNSLESSADLSCLKNILFEKGEKIEVRGPKKRFFGNFFN